MWIDIAYEYEGAICICSEKGFESAINRIESLTAAGAVVLKVERYGRWQRKKDTSTV